MEKVIEYTTWQTPSFKQCKLFYFTFDTQVIPGQRYLMNNFVEVSKHITTGIELMFNNLGTTPALPPTVSLDGKVYNLPLITELRNLRLTFCDRNGNILMYRQPATAFVKCNGVGFGASLELRRYMLNIYTGKSYFQWDDLIGFTPMPIAIPIMFYFDY